MASAIGVILLAEIGVRAIDANLTQPLVWHTYEAQKKVAQIDRLSSRGGAEVVFLGSSLMMTAMSAATLQRQFGGAVTAYNASLTLQIGRQAEVWGREVVLPKLRPKLFVIGVCSWDFTDVGPTRNGYYEALIHSPGGERVLGRQSPIDKVDSWMRDHSAIWRHRFQLREAKSVWRAVRGKAPVESGEVTAIQPDGHSTFVADRHLEEPAAGLRLNNNIWKPGTVDMAAYARLTAEAKAIGAKVVFVDMPVIPEFIQRHPRGQRDYDEYLEMLRALTVREGAEMISLSATITDHAYFADEVHLNAAGAAVFSKTLTDLLVERRLLPPR